MRCEVLALDGIFDTGLSAVLDVFTTANELIGLFNLGIPPFDVSVVGVRRRVRTAQGLSVPLTTQSAGAPADWVVVLARPDVRDASALLREQASRPGTRIAAACIGTFVLAESGLLNDQNSTTTWWLGSLFRQRYPRVRLDESHMIVASGRFVTAGAALSHVDLAMWLVRQVSPELASLVARYLIVDTRPAQSAYVVMDHLAHADPLVERFDHWARDHLGDGFSLDQAARATGTTTRTLARRLHNVLGKSPLSYVQDLRVERAVHLLRTSDRTLDEIASLVGYADSVTLRALLRRRLGRGVREIREHSPD
jgi:transcriptional regulator GlxA family with amidase domain